MINLLWISSPTSKRLDNNVYLSPTQSRFAMRMGWIAYTKESRISLLTEVWLISRLLEVQGHRLYQMFTAQTWPRRQQLGRCNEVSNYAVVLCNLTMPVPGFNQPPELKIADRMGKLVKVKERQGLWLVEFVDNVISVNCNLLCFVICVSILSPPPHMR